MNRNYCYPFYWWETESKTFWLIVLVYRAGRRGWIQTRSPNPTSHVFPHAFGCDSVPTCTHLGAGPQSPDAHLVMLQLSFGYQLDKQSGLQPETDGSSAPSVLCKPWVWLHMCRGRRVIICETFTSCLRERVWEADETLGGNGSWKAIAWYPTLNAKCSIQRSAASPIRRTTKKGRQRWMALIVSWL